MAKIEFRGIADYTAKLNRLEQRAEPVMRRAVFEGAKIVTDAIRAAISALTAYPDDAWAVTGTLKGPREWEKRAMLEGLGISKMENKDGVINAKIGFNGYCEHNGKQVPIPMIARSVESGTSTRFMEGRGAIRKAVNSAKGAAEDAMRRTLDEEIGNIMNS